MRRRVPSLRAAARALASAEAKQRCVAKLGLPVPTTSDPTLSVRLCMPFLRILARRKTLPAEDLERLVPRDLEARIPVSAVLTMLDGAVALTRDPDLRQRPVNTTCSSISPARRPASPSPCRSSPATRGS